MKKIITGFIAFEIAVFSVIFFLDLSVAWSNHYGYNLLEALREVAMMSLGFQFFLAIIVLVGLVIKMILDWGGWNESFDEEKTDNHARGKEK